MEFGRFFVYQMVMGINSHKRLRARQQTVNNLSPVYIRNRGNDLHSASIEDRNGLFRISQKIYHWLETFNKKMAELKLGWLILIHTLGASMYSYALFVEWGTVKGAILTVLGIIYAIFQIMRIFIKTGKEWYGLRQQVKDFHKKK